jgi:phosphatidate cytidylyltransferase
VLKTRVLTAIVLLAGLLLALFALPKAVAAVLLVLVMAQATWEWGAFAGLGGQRLVRIGYLLATLGFGYLTWSRTQAHADFVALLVIACLFWGIALARLFFHGEQVQRVATLFAGWLALLPTGIALARIVAIDGPRPGAVWFLLLLLLVSAADIGAYFAGRRFGRLKLAPQISPGKTWEGVVGGALLVAVVASVAASFLGLPAAGLVGLSGVVFVASIVGDLTESLYKRSVGIKDSGTVLPGHGGALDRIDSLLAATPFYALGLVWLGVLT